MSMFDTASFATASENMIYDKNQFLLHEQNENNCYFRFYSWQAIGLTQTEKRKFPQILTHLDHAYRVTGGGIVFHCPGDIVFAHSAPVNHPILPSNIKKRCLWMAQTIQSGLIQSGIPVSLAGDSPPAHSERNILFCNAYHNPYECMLADQKVCGIAVKKTRSFIIFQGSIHLKSTFDYFPQLASEYGNYFTKGCSTQNIPTTETIIQTLKDTFLKALNN